MLRATRPEQSQAVRHAYNPKPLLFARIPEPEMAQRSESMLTEMQRRRSVRAFSSEPAPLQIIESAILTAGTAPSGAHQQPWTFVMVTDLETRLKMRAAAEAEERKSYDERMSPAWLEALAPLGTDWEKPHLTDAPCVIVVFEQAYGVEQAPDGSIKRVKHYYVQESVGIAVGFLLAALHHAGLAALTHTPSPMTFLRDLLGRPENERPFVVIPVGYPSVGADVPDLTRKTLSEILIRR